MKEWLSTIESAKYLGIHKRTLERWRKAGTGPKFMQVAEKGAVRYNKAELDAYVSGE